MSGRFPSCRLVAECALFLVRRSFGMCALGLVVLLPSTFGQATASTTNPADEPGDIIELSPFSVEAGEDDGYVATSSLAGTRIKSNLRDIANSITVVTKEFLKDINASDASELLVYTGNTETAGPGGNFSNANVGASTEQVGYRNPQNNSRVRGLASADLTRDYFPTTIVFDGYNTDRVEINRGPNATLFGLGSPGGIINNQLIQPMMKNAGSLEFNLGSFGTTRTVLDVDRVIVPGTLGIRFAAVYENEEFQQSFAFDRDRRFFVALKAKPFDNANFKVSYESGEVDANRPRTNSPRDTLTRWWDPSFNKVTHDPANTEFNKIDRDILRAPGNWFFQPGIVYENNDAKTPERMMYAWYNLLGVPRVPGGPGSVPFQANMVSITKGDQWFPSATAAKTGVKYGSFFIDDEIGDVSIFDWRNQLFDGPNKHEWEDFNALNVSYDQSWKHGLGTIGFEAAYNREDLSRNWYGLFTDGRGYTINIDNNTTLPWGAPNPNFGRPFVASPSTRSTTDGVRETGRFTGFLELDFAKNSSGIARWLGRHSLTGFYNTYSLDEQSYSGSNRTGLEWANFTRRKTTTPNDLNNGDAQLITVVYLGPSLANLSSPKGIKLQGIQTVLNPEQNVTGYAWDQDKLAFTTIQSTGQSVYDDDTFRRLTSGANLTRQKIESYAFVDQLHLLPGEWIVGTYGWRHDKVEDFRRNVAAADRNQFGMVDLDNPNFRIPDQPGSVFEEDIVSYGVVMYTPPFLPMPGSVKLSVHYNQSENFQPADARIDIFGNAIQPPGGETKDYGFTVSMFNDKFQARFNWFDSNSSRATQGYLGFLAGETDARVIAYNTPAAVAAAGWKGPPQFFKDLTAWEEISSPSTISGKSIRYSRPGNMQDTQSTSSKGFELDLTYNPRPNWRVAFNAAQQKAARADIAPASKKFLALRIDEWLTGPTADLISDESGQPVKVRIYDTLLNNLNGILAREGQAVSELREWRANLITNYAFGRESKLKGFSIGGAIRWQDEVGIGYPIHTVPSDGGGTIDTPDLSTPFNGPSELRVDLWIGYSRKIWDDKVKWKLQLNIRNALDDDGLVPVVAQPDGSIGSWFAPVGRTFNLKSVFEF